MPYMGRPAGSWWHREGSEAVAHEDQVGAMMANVGFQLEGAVEAGFGAAGLAQEGAQVVGFEAIEDGGVETALDAGAGQRQFRQVQEAA